MAKRSLAHWRLLSSVVIGVLLASTIMAGTVIYFDALRALALKTALSQLSTSESDIVVRAERGPTSFTEYEKVSRAVDREVDGRVAWLLRGRERGGKTDTFFLTASGREETAGDDNARTYFAFLEGLDQHITLLPPGKMPEARALSSPGEPLELEAIIPEQAARLFGVGVGDRLSAVPHWDDVIPYASVVISGVFERNDPDEQFWRLQDDLFRSSTAVGFRTVPFFLSEQSYMDVLGGAFRDLDSSYAWLLEVDVGRLNAQNSQQAAFDIRRMNRRLSTSLFSYWQLTSLDRTLADFDRRLFFAKLPMFVVLILMAVVILYYVATLSSMFVDQQRSEVALLKSRGASSAQILGVFVLEGATIALMAALVAPLLAAIAVSLLGFTPAFSELGGADRLDARITREAYMMSGLGGALSFIALIIPAFQASRIDVVRHRQQAARPSDRPFYQRYYLDVMLLVLSLFLFRQLTEQGSVVAVQLFGDVAVDQILLGVPALMLVASAMVLLRLFPMALRFLSGDSLELLHLVVAGMALLLVPGIVANGLLDGQGTGWLVQVLLLAAMVGAYWATAIVRGVRLRVAGMALQAGLIAGIVVAGPALPMNMVFVPILLAVVPAQALFSVLRAFAQRAPVGYTIGLWQMARNPTHYARLSLLLILSAGLGIFAASFGGTLELSYLQRALYSTGADIRLEGVRLNTSGPSQPLEAYYENITGIGQVTPVFRGFGVDLSRFFGITYTMFAMDSQRFSEVAWFRDDFANEPIDVLLNSLSSATLSQGIELPGNGRDVAVTLRSDRPHESVVVTAGLRDANGRYFARCLGTLESTEWRTLEARRDNRACGRRFFSRSRLQPVAPVMLVSLAVHERDRARRLRAGAVSIDDIRVRTADGRWEVIDTMADASAWSVLRVAPESDSDTLTDSQLSLNGDDGFLRFSWSDGRSLVGRGIYHGPQLGPLPVLVNREFLSGTDRKVGDELTVSVAGQRVQVKLVDSIKYFPTLDTVTKPYLIADLASLSRHVNLENATSELIPNEIWMTEKINGGRSEALLAQLSSNEPFSIGALYDRTEVIDASKADPLVEAGWSALLFIAFAAVLILSGLGFLVHAYVSFRNREVEFALMRTLGFTLKQLVALVWLEQALVIGVGMVLGSWMGGRLGAVIMPFLDHDETGRHVLPPFVLEINWTTLVIAYVAMSFVFAVIIAGVVWFIHKISLQRILRLGEV